MTGLLNPAQSLEIGKKINCMIFVVHLGHDGVSHPVVAVLFYSPNRFVGEVSSSQTEKSQKKSGAPLL